MRGEKMSESREGLEAELLGGTLMWGDKKTGKPIFELKRKDMKHYGGEGCYYIFKVHERNFSSEEDRNEFFALGLPMVKRLAGGLGLALYDLDELNERSPEAILRLRERGVDCETRQVDVKIEVFDHGSGRLQVLVHNEIMYHGRFYFLYFFSPARIGTLSQFSGDTKGQV